MTNKITDLSPAAIKIFSNVKTRLSYPHTRQERLTELNGMLEECKSHQDTLDCIKSAIETVAHLDESQYQGLCKIIVMLRNV